MTTDQIACCYVLQNSETSQIKIGCTKSLTRRLWEHESGLEGFELLFYVPFGLNPFVLEKMLHRFIGENDLIQEMCSQREVYKCDLEPTIQALKNYINSIEKIVWYLVPYPNASQHNKFIVLLRIPQKRQDFTKKEWTGRLEIKDAFDEYIKPIYWKQYYLQHKETIKTRTIQYYHANKERIISQMKERYQRRKANASIQPMQ